MKIKYSLPGQLAGEIDQLELLIAGFKKGEISATELKAHRVPFGVYEQREADTYMVRIRCAAGIVTPEQLAQVAKIGLGHGQGDLHITSRQELQIHYVKLDEIVTVIRKLKDAGLATRGGGGNTVRNIAAGDDSGFDQEEVFDVTPYAIALTDRLIAESDSWNLPRKFKIAFSGSPQDKGYATLSDAGFIAKIKDGKKGFAVYAAGGLGAKPAVGNLLLDFVEDNQVYPVAEALKNLFFKYGNRKNKHAARLRFLWQNLGEEEFRKKFQEELVKVKEKAFPELVIDESGQNDLVRLPDGYKLQELLDPAGSVLWQKRFVRKQKQLGLFAVLIPVELGFISSAKVEALAGFLRPFGDDVLRMTKDQNFLLRNIPEKALGNVYNFLSEEFITVRKPAFFSRVLSCAGASTCQLGICLSRQAAKALMSVLAVSGLDLDLAGELKLNISGCPNACGHHLAADLGFSGKALWQDGRLYPAYSVYAGAVIQEGRTKLAEYLGDVPAKSLPELVKEFVAGYLSESTQFKDLKEYIAGEGKTQLKELVLKYKQVPGFDEDKNFYFDWSAVNLFSLAERRAGECSAGMFDLIEVDLANIRGTKKKLSSRGLNPEDRSKLLRDLVFYSSRMLLVTRGSDLKAGKEVYASFQKNFIDTGLIEPFFTNLLVKAEAEDYPALLAQEPEVFSFAQAVESLYENMDNSFNFKKALLAQSDSQESNLSQPSAPAALKDLRGVVCPLNFVKTKVELAKLKPGDTLEIWLDDGPPIENVPGSVLAEGHLIVQQKKVENYWLVVIEKK